MQNYKEQQEEIRKPSSAISAKKERKTTEWEDQRALQENQRFQGNISCKDGLDKAERNGINLTEAEDIKKRWQECTEELYKKDLHDPENHDGVITLLEPDILEY